MSTKTGIAIVSFALTCFTVPVQTQGIIAAVKSGDIENVRAMLGQDAELVNVKDDRGCSLLHYASEGGYKEVAELLIAHGAAIDAKEINGNTPLHYAARNGKADVAELLLSKGADINAQNKDGFTSLHWTARNNHKTVLELLLAAGAKPDIRENRGMTVLVMSIWWMKDLGAARLLIDKGADMSARVEGSWVTPIAVAAQYGLRDIVDLLIDKGAVVDEKNRVLVRMAVANGLERLFKIVSEKGADLNVATNTGGSMLHFAGEGGSPEIIKILLDKGFKLDEADRYGWTPLHYAAYNARRDAVAFLLDRGADIDKKNLSGKSPFNIAVERGFSEISRLLASKRADQSPQKLPVLTGEYLGQRRPGAKPEVFALDIVSTPEMEHGSVTFSPDGTTIYWTGGYRWSGPQGPQGSFKVLSSHIESDQWTAPQYAFFTGDLRISDDVPFLSPDGRRLIFMSKRPIKPGGKEERDNYWVIDRTETGWSQPKLIDDAVLAMTIRWQISVSNNGTLYFGSTDGGGRGGSDIYISRLVNGKYSKPENVGETINTEFSESSPFIAPDESYLIFGKEAQGDRTVKNGLYIAFRGADGKWTTPIYMGDEINSGGAGTPYVSPDGKYLFFNSGRNGNYDVYWVDAKIINDLKPGELK